MSHLEPSVPSTPNTTNTTNTTNTIEEILLETNQITKTVNKLNYEIDDVWLRMKLNRILSSAERIEVLLSNLKN